MLAQLPTDTHLLPHHSSTDAMAAGPHSGIIVHECTGLKDSTPTIKVLDLSSGQNGEGQEEEEKRRSILNK